MRVLKFGGSSLASAERFRQVANIIMDKGQTSNLAVVVSAPQGVTNHLVAMAENISDEAKLVKLADKICNLRDVADNPPAGWGIERRQEYYDWAQAVIDGLRGIHPELEAIFDQAYARRPE